MSKESLIIMSNEKSTIVFSYTLTPEWQEQIVEHLGAKLIQNKILMLPASVASGYSLFLQIIPGLSVSLLDFVFHIPVKFIREPSGNKDHYVVYYDMNEEVTTHSIGGRIKKTSYHAKLGMAFIDGEIKNVITPPVKNRSNYLRLIVDKFFFKSLTNSSELIKVNKFLLNNSNNNLFFYKCIDSKSRLLLKEIKDKSINDPSFETHLRGIAFQLLYYLLECLSSQKNDANNLSERDSEHILKTSTYLMENLMADFPGQSFLAEMAQMSNTKFNISFRKVLKESPKYFFLREKMRLGENMLLSGNFNSISDVAYSLGYSTTDYFSARYKKIVGVSPINHFKKKDGL